MVWGCDTRFEVGQTFLDFFDVHVYLGRINPFLYLTDAPHETDDRRSVFNSLV